MKKFGLILMLGLFLQGCVLDEARTRGAEVADKILETGIRITCTDTTVGAVARRYGQSRETLNQWLVFCFGNQAPRIDVARDTPK